MGVQTYIVLGTIRVYSIVLNCLWREPHTQTVPSRTLQNNRDMELIHYVLFCKVIPRHLREFNIEDVPECSKTRAKWLARNISLIWNHIPIFQFRPRGQLFLSVLRGMYQVSRRAWSPTPTFTFSHLADAFIQIDVQGREYSSYEQ